MSDHLQKPSSHALPAYFSSIGLDLSRCRVEIASEERLPAPFDLDAREYLARSQVQSEQDDGIIDAIANAKRAMDCRLSELLACYGFAIKGKNFHEKLQTAERLGLLTPAVLKRYNALRNEIEHDFALPARDEAREAVGVAELFLEATENCLRSFPTAFMIVSTDEGGDGEDAYYLHCCINFDSVTRAFHLWTQVPGDPEHHAAPGSPDHDALLRVVIRLARGRDPVLSALLHSAR